MKPFHCLCRPKIAVLSSLFLAACFTPFASAQDAATKPVEAPKETDGKMPPMKVDPAPLAQVGALSSLAPVVEKVAPGVVTISTSKNVKPGQNPYFNDPMFRRFFGIPDGEDQAPDGARPPRGGRRGGGNVPDEGGAGNGRKRKQMMGLGSGVVVSADGHILTNNHVVEGADDILVTIGNNKHEYKAKKIGTDPGTDLAVLKIEATGLPAVTFADSDKIKVGDLAIAVGNPFGLTQSVTMGIVSAIGRGGTGITDFENFIQTDASINPGNSGGALVDTQGRLIGINTAIYSRTGGNQGIGFAVPSNLARTVMESIVKTGHVTRGFLGIHLQPLSEDLAKAFSIPENSGALVADVESGSPADKAGIQNGDIVAEVSGKKVEGPRELQLMVAAMAPGSKVDVKILRKGATKTVKVELGERPNKGLASAPEEKKSDDPDVLDGVTVSDIDADTRKELEIPEGTKGVVITKIEPDSPSADAGLQRGDIIYEINREPVTNAKQAVDLSEKLKKETKVLLRVSSRGNSRYVVIERKE